jgi:hypothetical protein
VRKTRSHTCGRKGAVMITCITLWAIGQSQTTDSPLLSQHRTLIGLIDRPLSVVCQRKLTRYITANLTKSQIALLKRRAPHQSSPPYSSITFTSPPFPSRSWISIPIDHHSESLLMAKNRRRTRKKRTKQDRRMSVVASARHPAMTTY